MVPVSTIWIWSYSIDSIFKKCLINFQTLNKIDSNTDENNHLHSFHAPQDAHAHSHGHVHTPQPEAMGLHSNHQHHANHQVHNHDSPIHRVTEAPAKQSSLDIHKLQEAIMSGYNKHLAVSIFHKNKN